MKKLLILLVLPLFLMSCGGDDTNENLNTYDSSNEEVALGFWTMLPAVVNSIELMMTDSVEATAAVDPETIIFANYSTCGDPNDEFINTEGTQGAITLTDCEIADYFCGNSSLLTFSGVLNVEPKNESFDNINGQFTTTGFIQLGCGFSFDVPSGLTVSQIDQITGVVCGINMTTLVPMAETLLSGDNASICDAI